MTEASEYLKSCKEQMLSRCQYLKKKPAGDEIWYLCDFDDYPCIVEYGDEECVEYEDIKKEWLKATRVALDNSRKVKYNIVKEG